MKSESNPEPDGDHILKTQENDLKSKKVWEMSASQYQYMKGVHAPWIFEISPSQYAGMSKRAKKAYDEKRRKEWEASANIKREWRDKVIEAYLKQEVTLDTPELHSEGRDVILYYKIELKKEKQKKLWEEALKENKIHSLEELQIGDRVFDILYNDYGEILKIFKKSIRLKSERGPEFTAPLFRFQWLRYNDLKEYYEEGKAIRPDRFYDMKKIDSSTPYGQQTLFEGEADKQEYMAVPNHIPEKLEALTDTVRVQLIETRPIPKPGIRITNPIDVADVVSYMQDKDREFAKVLYLNRKNGLIGLETVAIGTLSGALTTPREILKGAVLANASRIIFVHNHPSGSVQASKEDREFTGRLVQACRLMEIELIDSIIIGKGKYTSLLQKEPELFELIATATQIPAVDQELILEGEDKKYRCFICNQKRKIVEFDTPEEAIAHVEKEHPGFIDWKPSEVKPLIHQASLISGDVVQVQFKVPETTTQKLALHKRIDDIVKSEQERLLPLPEEIEEKEAIEKRKEYWKGLKEGEPGAEWMALVEELYKQGKDINEILKTVLEKYSDDTTDYHIQQLYDFLKQSDEEPREPKPKPEPSTLTDIDTKDIEKALERTQRERKRDEEHLNSWSNLSLRAELEDRVKKGLIPVDLKGWSASRRKAWRDTWRLNKPWINLIKDSLFLGSDSLTAFWFLKPILEQNRDPEVVDWAKYGESDWIDRYDKDEYKALILAGVLRDYGLDLRTTKEREADEKADMNRFEDEYISNLLEEYIQEDLNGDRFNSLMQSQKIVERLGVDGDTNAQLFLLRFVPDLSIDKFIPIRQLEKRRPRARKKGTIEDKNALKNRVKDMPIEALESELKRGKWFGTNIKLPDWSREIITSELDKRIKEPTEAELKNIHKTLNLLPDEALTQLRIYGEYRGIKTDKWSRKIAEKILYARAEAEGKEVFKPEPYVRIEKKPPLAPKPIPELPKPKLPPPPDLKEIPTEVANYLKLTHLNVVKKPKFIALIGFNKQVYVIPVRDEGTGDVYNIVMGTPYTKTEHYILTRITNKRGRITTALVVKQEALAIEPKMPTNHEMRETMRKVKADVITSAPPPAEKFSWSWAKDIAKKMKVWIETSEKRANNKLPRQAIPVYVQIRSIKEFSEQMLKSMHTVQPTLEKSVKKDIPKDARKFTEEDYKQQWKDFVSILKAYDIKAKDYKKIFDSTIAWNLAANENTPLIDQLASEIIEEHQLALASDFMPKITLTKDIRRSVYFSWKHIARGLTTLRLELQRLFDAIQWENSVELSSSATSTIEITKRLLTHMQYLKEIRDFLSIEERGARNL